MLKPYLGAETYNDLVRDIFHQDAGTLNKLYETLTGKDPGPVDGISVVLSVIDGLQHNDIGTFVSMMKQEE